MHRLALIAQEVRLAQQVDYKMHLALALALLESTLRLEPLCAQTAQLAKCLLPVVRPQMHAYLLYLVLLALRGHLQVQLLALLVQHVLEQIVQ